MKRVYIFILIISTIVISSMGTFAATPPTSGRIIDHSPFHTGVDVFSKPSEKIYSPIVGNVIRIERAENVNWHGIIIKGIDDDSNYTLRILGIKPLINVAAKVDARTILGIAEDPGIDFPGIKPYLHFELYQDGKRIDPIKFVTDRLPHRSIIDAAIGVDYDSKIIQLLNKAKNLGKDAKYSEAINLYLEALKYPSWETTNTYILHYIADNYAQLGKFAEAVKTQKEMLKRLNYELEYSLGSLPDKSLGIIAAVNTEESLRVLIGNHSMNQKAYEEKKQTYIHY
jgi:tetratricopeptide (TPR) repeat protein